MGKVIFNSDDFGYSRGVNYGIADAYQLGILTSTTLMANMPGFEHAVQLKKELPGLGVGVHLTLTCGKPILKNLETIVDGDKFRTLSFYEKADFSIDLEELYQEWNAQIQKVYKSGVIPTHLDSHHHTHTFNKNQEVVVELARKYNLPVRGNFDLRNQVKTTEYFEPLFDEVGRSENEPSNLLGQPLELYLEELIKKIQEKKSSEIMCHSAYIDSQLYNNSSFVFSRINQVEFLTHSNFAKRIKEDGKIELATFKDI